MNLTVALSPPSGLQNVQFRPGWLISSFELETCLLENPGKIRKLPITRVKLHIHHQTAIPQGSLKRRRHRAGLRNHNIADNEFGARFHREDQVAQYADRAFVRPVVKDCSQQEYINSSNIRGLRLHEVVDHELYPTGNLWRCTRRCFSDDGIVEVLDEIRSRIQQSIPSMAVV